MKIQLTVASAFALALGGCVHTPYRYEVHDTGEGSVRVDRVPKEPAETTVTTTPPPATAATSTEQQRIAELQAQVRALSVENQKLRQAVPTTTPTTEPTTAPVKE
jgi:hypothetical protein